MRMLVMPLLANALEQGAHAGLMHFAAQGNWCRASHRAMWAVASPMPKPISSTNGALRPKAAVASSGSGVRQQKARAQVFKGLGLPVVVRPARRT
jgi:hypothetical protein